MLTGQPATGASFCKLSILQSGKMLHHFVLRGHSAACRREKYRTGREGLAKPEIVLLSTTNVMQRCNATPMNVLQLLKAKTTRKTMRFSTLTHQNQFRFP